jgi:hypothetical protein
MEIEKVFIEKKGLNKYVLAFKNPESEYNRYYNDRPDMLSTINLEYQIISLGRIKIKNYLIKNFNAFFNDNNGYQKYVPYFSSQEDAEKALEWMKQKIFEATLIGKDVLEKETRQKRIEDTNKKEEKEKEKIEKEANKHINYLKQYIGKQITIPAFISSSEIHFTTILLDINYEESKDVIGGFYTLTTSNGIIKLSNRDIIIKEDMILSSRDGRSSVARSRISGNTKIIFK